MPTGSEAPHLSAAVVRTLPFLGAALLLALSPPAAGAQRATLDAAMRDTLLGNGLHVIAVPNPIVPMVTIQVVVRNGAFTQMTDADQGIAHLLEHMLFRSFGRDGFGPEASKLHGSYNGTTGDETVTYYMTLPSENLDKGVKLMADLMREPTFRREQLESEQLVVRGELERSVVNPHFLLGVQVNQRLWGDAWHRKNTIGNVVTIQGASVDRLKQVYKQFYLPNNAAVVLTGDVTASQAFALTARHFSLSPDVERSLEARLHAALEPWSR